MPEVSDKAVALLLAVPGVLALAVASEGYWGGALLGWQRIAFGFAGLGLLFPVAVISQA